LLSAWIQLATTFFQWESHGGDAYYAVGSGAGAFTVIKLTSVDSSPSSSRSTKWDRTTFQELAPRAAERVLDCVRMADTQIQWTHRPLGFDIGQRTFAGASGALQVQLWKLPLWSVILPLTLPCIWLLFRSDVQQRKQQRQSPRAEQ